MNVVDLTHTLRPDFPSFTGECQFKSRLLGTLVSEGFNYGEWTLEEHTGTHLDAPFHKSDRTPVDAIPAARLAGPLVVVDIRQKARTNPDAQLTRADLRAWESRHGAIPPGAVVILWSGWDALVRTARFRNEDSRGRMHFPGFHVAAVEWLLAERDVVGIGVDTLSLDRGLSADFPVHTRWLGANRWGLECVANLAAVPAAGATVVVGCPKVAGASGSPCRVLAFAKVAGQPPPRSSAEAERE